jgi:hypothetical protein
LINTRFMSVSPEELCGRTLNEDSTVWRTRSNCERGNQ